MQAVGGVAAHGGEQQVADEAGEGVGLAGTQVGELGGPAQVGIVDGEGDPLVGIEERVHDRRVAVEGGGDRLDVLQAALVVRDGVDARPQRVELVELLEGGAVGDGDVAALVFDLRPERGDRGVDGLAGLGVVLHRQGDRLLRTHGVDRGGVALVLQDAQQAERADGRLGEDGLLSDPARFLGGLHDLQGGDDDEGEQRDRKGARQLHANRNPAQRVSG